MYFYRMKKGKIATLTILCSGIFFFSVIFFSCKKSNSDVPFVNVNEYLNLSLPSYISLNAVNGWVYYGAGNKGLIVFRRSGSEFVVYDRTCTYDPTSVCQINVVTNNILATDSCCGSKFSLFDGSVTNGPASQPLKQYHADYSNNTLHIYN